MKKNMGSTDRIVRVLVAIVVLVLGLTRVIHGTLFLVLGILAAVLLLTSIIGVCPLYVPLRMSTRPKPKQ